MRRPLATLALLLAGISSAASAQMLRETGAGHGGGGEKLDTAYAEAIIRLDIENGPSAVVPALANNTTLLLPLRQYFSLAEVHLVAMAPRDSAFALMEPGHTPLRFRPSARLLVRGTSAIAYDTMDVIWWDGELFVSTTILDRLLGTVTSVEWADLSAMVAHAGGLPVVQRARRERRRQLMVAAAPPTQVLDLPLRERPIDGAVMTWSLTAATHGSTDQRALDLGLGAGLLGGSAELRPQFYSSGDASGADLRATWSRVFQRSPWIRQLGLGDVQSSGRRSRLLEGLVVTNAPFIRSSEFDVEQLVGSVPAGWEVELYEGGRLLGYADADALGSFRVPLELRYGQNPFDLVMYGPAGETQRQHRTVRIPFSRLPDHRFEYSFAAGHCRYDPCDGMISSDARFGLSNRVTLQGGMDAFFAGTAGSLVQPYAIVSAAPLPALSLTGEAVVNGQLRAAAEYEPTMDLHVTAGYTSFSPGGAVYGGNLSESNRTEATLFWRPGWMNGMLYIQGNGLHSGGPSLSRSLERIAVTTRYGRVRYGLGVLRDELRSVSAPTTSDLAFDASADLLLMGPWKWIRTANLQGQLAFDPAYGLTAIRGSIGRRFSRVVRLDGSLGWFRGMGYSLELSFATAMPGPRFGARSRVSGIGGTEALTYAYGSVAYDPRSQLLRLGDGSDLGRAGIRGVVFRDDNGNGVRDPGEPGLAGIPVRVGGYPAETDADGHFAAWGLYPSELAEIQIDTLSFGDPHFILPAQVLRVRPSANSFGTISVPVTVGAEVSGYVGFGDQGLPGVPVILREMNSGVEITIFTFADGAFYRAAVPPGEYEVTLPDAVLDRLHALAPPLSIFVPPGLGDKRFEDLQLRLQARP